MLTHRLSFVPIPAMKMRFTALIALAIASSIQLKAQTSWDFSGEGAFTTPGNWSAGLPTGTTNTFITNGTNTTPSVVDLSGSGNVQNFTLGGFDSLNIGLNSSLYVSGSTVSNGGVINVNGGSGYSSFFWTNSSNVTLQGAGTVNLNTLSGGSDAYLLQAASNETLTNFNNTIQGSGVIGNNGLTFVNQAGGTIDANGAVNANSSGGALALQGLTALTNAGLLEATGSGVLNVNGVTINNAGGTITASSGGTVQLYSNTDIQGGTLTNSSSTLGTTQGNVFLDGSTTAGAITLNGTYTAALNTGTYLLGTINNNNNILVNGGGGYNTELYADSTNVTLQGGGTVTLSTASGAGSAILMEGSADLTLTNVNNTIQGSGIIGDNGLTLVNQAGGTINANVSGGALALQSLTLTNAGLAEATGGGVLNINGITVDNSGGTITAGSGSTVQLYASADIQGGTLTNNGGTLGTIANYNAILDGSTNGAITLNGTYTGALNSSTYLVGTVNNTGNIQLNGGSGFNTFLTTGGNVMLQGGGTVTLSTAAGGANAIIDQAAAGQTLTNVNNTIQGNGIIGENGLTLVNEGTINANVSGGALALQTLQLTNESLVEATGGGVLNLNGITVNNSGGNITAGSGSTVQLYASADIQGGTLTNNGGTLGTISNYNAFLDGTTNGAITLNGTYTGALNSTTYLVGTINNTGNIQLNGGSGSNTFLTTDGNVMLQGGGTVTLSTAAGGGNAYINQVAAGETLTNVDNTIQGNGIIGNNGLLLNNESSGTVLANVSGGTLAINGGGAVTNSGTFQVSAGSTMAVSSPLTNFSAGTLTGGVYVVTGNVSNTGTMQINSFGTTGGELVTNSATIGLNGVNSNLVDQNGLNALNYLGTGLTTNTATGNFDISQNRVFTSVGNLSNAGGVQVSGTSTNLIVGPLGVSTYTQTAGSTLLTTGGTLTAADTHISGGTVYLTNGNIVSPILTNDVGGTITGSGSITSLAVSNQGLIQAAGPSLTLSNGVTGTGTLQSNENSDLSLAGGVTSSTTGTLELSGPVFAATQLALGTNNVTVSTIYTNSNFGVGNSFNNHANVTGTGKILASGNAALTITGADVTNGGTATPSLANFGNVHVNQTVTDTFAIQNSGTTGPSVTGAIQTSVNGGNITSPALSGTGVTAQNFAQLAPGQSTGTYSVTYAPTTAGALAGGQTIHVASNFDNVTGPTLTVGSGAAYAYAAVNTLSTPINLGPVHVGGTLSTALNITNTAAPTGGYTENLGASLGGTTGAATSAGSITGLGAGGSSSAISVGLNTGTAGALTGTATVGFTSQAIAAGLTNTSLGSQTVTINGTAYNLAQVTLGSINIGNVLVGSNPTVNLNVLNSGPAGSYTEGLDALVNSINTTLNSVSAPTLLASTNSLTNIGVGTSQNLQFTLNTSAAGTIGGNVAVNLFSDGLTTSGLGTTFLGTQSASVVGIIANVGNLANPSAATPNPVTLNARVGAASPTQALSIMNIADGGNQEGLNASISTASTGVTASGSFTSLAAGSTNNSSLVVGINTATAGSRNGSATIALASDGTYNSGVTTSLGTQTITVQGGVYQEAAATIAPVNTVNLGNSRIGGTLGQSLTITNSAPNTGGYTENLGGSFVAASQTGSANAATGSFTGVAQGASSNAIGVGLSTGTAGAIAGSVTLAFETEAINGSGLGTASIGTQTVNLSGGVYQAAEANTLPTTINLGTVRTGTVVNSTSAPALALSIQNVAPATSGYTENLGASFGAVSSGLTGSGSPINGITVGSTSNAMALSYTAGAAGSYAGSAVVNFQTQAINSSGLGNAGIGSQTVDVDATVNAIANGVVQQNGGTYSFASTGADSGTLNFGAITQGDGTVGDALELLNDVTGDADFLTGGYSPALIGPFSYTPGNGATFDLGDMQASDFDVSFNTDYSPTGFVSETLVISENSSNDSQGAMALQSYDLTIEGTINPVGVSSGVPDASATWLLLGLGLASLVIVRRRAVV